jgi:RNA polymerase sigma-70 factor (ECF subfamily)
MVDDDRKVGASDRLPGAAAVGGNASAFDRLIGPLVEPGYRLAFTMLGRREDAEDAVQEATINAWRNLHRLQDKSAARSWFLAIVANQCRSTRRGRWWSIIKLGDPEQHRAGPEEQTVQRSDLQRALKRLDPDERLALFLRYYMDLGLSEVAAVLGISETAAKSRIHRAAQRLRPVLAVPEVLS